MQARGFLFASMIVGLGYFISWQLDISAPFLTVWKGAGVALLALYAAANARSVDGWLLVVVMVLGALGDVLLEAIGLEAGAAAFVVGHIVAVVLYLRNRRSSLTLSQKLLGLVIVPVSVIIAVGLVLPAETLAIAVYTLFVGAMTAAAWTSRFPRYRTGIGAVMFLASDLLIFASMGPLSAQDWTRYAIWGLYYVGQLLIVIGVVSTLAKISEPTTAVIGNVA